MSALPEPPPLSEFTQRVLAESPKAATDPHADLPHPAERTGQEGHSEKSEKKSASTLLVEIAEELYQFGVSDAGHTFGVPRAGHKVVRMLRGGKTSLRAQLSREYFRRTGKAAPQQALADALLVVEGIAQDEDEQALYLRVAQHDGALWLDLGDASGRAVRITADGWTVEERAPVLFKRTALNSPLPQPVHGDELAELWRWLNVTQDDQPLVAAWLVAVLFCDIPHPILSISGEQGTGKSTAERVLVSILDPSPVPTRKPPRDADSWVTAAAGSWVVGLDNLSDVPPWLSDSLCRAVTGDGDVRRKLYTDGDMAVFAFRRCLILNGIDFGAVRGDLADRLLPIQLDVIDESRRLQETELWPKWTDVHPRILGAVLDLVAGVQAVLPSVHLARRPRMADYAQLLAAVDRVLGTAGLARYLSKQRELATDSLTGDQFITAIAKKLDGQFAGTAAELLARVTPTSETWRAPKEWPTTARQVTQRLRRQGPVMRKASWLVQHRSNRDKVIVWEITPPEKIRKEDPQHPQHPHFQVAGHDECGSTLARDPQTPGDNSAGHDGVAGLAGDEYKPSPGDKPCDRCPSTDTQINGAGYRLCREHAGPAWKESA